jgi:Na+-translocating ferredoxin:NAD+ oxidoreductase subunit G
MRSGETAADGALAVYLTMTSIAVAAGLLIALAFEWTEPRITQARERLQRDAVLDVLPGAVTWQGYELPAVGPPRPLADGAGTPRLFAGRDDAGRLVGIAIAAEGMGYQDRIRLLYGVDRAGGVLLGLQVLESRETPGLGARIADDADFLARFRALPLAFDEAGMPRPLRVTDAAPGPGELHGITGATVSVNAVARIVGDSLIRWWPHLEALGSDDG